MFKKTLIALSVVGMSSTAVSLTIHPSKDPSSNPIVVQTPSITNVASLDLYAATAYFVHLDANYNSGNTIQVSYTGAAIDEDYIFPTAAISLTADTDTTASTCAASQIASFAGWNATTLTATYQFTGITAATDGCVMAIPVINVDGASLSTTDTFSVSAKGATAFGTLETLAASKLIDVAVNNIAQTVATPINGIIDVENARTQLTDSMIANTADATDTVTVTMTEGTQASGAADLLGSKGVITGNFAWTKKTAADGTVSRVGVTVSNSTALVITDTSVAYTASAAGTLAHAIVLTPQTADDKTILATTAYSLATTYTYDNGIDATVLSDTLTAALGAWTINGASIVAYGIPNSAAVTPFLWIQNKGVSVGEISVDVICDGTAIPTISAGTAAAKSNTSIASIVQAGVDAAGTCAAGSRYDASITVNGPAADMTATSGYRVTAADGSNDRLGLETSDSLD
jgi:hypothetical protein